MQDKRALIVDDSKSARVVLSRLLERHDIAVDAVACAEDALVYLETRRPDVVFMDHLMPGMDGFQAVQAIKGDPRTADIPVLMYTSQEGELYVSQARGLGASGVLPKQLAPIDVSKVLYDLDLLRARAPDGDGPPQQPLPLPGEAGVTTSPAALPAEGAPPPIAGEVELPPAPAPAPGAPAPGPALREVIEPLLAAHATDLRRFVIASLETFAVRVSEDTRTALAALQPPPPAPRTRPAPWVWATAATAVLAVGLGGVAERERRELQSLAQRVASAEQALGAARAALPAPAAAEAAHEALPGPGARGLLQSLHYPYGEAPLAGSRFEAFTRAAQDAEHRGVAGTLRVQVHGGDFCLTGNPGEGYSPAPDELAANRCDLVGNPRDDAGEEVAREAGSIAEYASQLNARTHGALTAEFAHAGRAYPLRAYPAAASASAAQWNEAANANQRVEISFEPRPATP